MDEKLRNEIVQRWQARTSQRRIARELGVALTTVRRVIQRFEKERASQALPCRLRQPSKRSSLLDEHDSLIRQLLERYPNMTAVRIHEELLARGIRSGHTIIRERVRRCGRSR